VVAESPDTRRPDDDELMGRLRTNDATALDLLFDRYSRLVLGIALRVLRDYGEAEDVVQEVFFHVFQKASLFDPQKGSAKVGSFKSRSIGPSTRGHISVEGVFTLVQRSNLLTICILLCP